MVNHRCLYLLYSRLYKSTVIFLFLLPSLQTLHAQADDSKVEQQQKLLLSKKQQAELALQQQQKELFERQKLQLAEQEKTLLKLQFDQKQNQLLQEQKEQAIIIQKNQLQAKYEASIKDKQISNQKESLAYNNKWIFFLVTLSVLIIAIAVITLINQRKTKKLNTFIFQQNKELEQISLVKDRVLGVVGHDMRSPLNMLQSFSQLLKYGKIPPEKMDAYLDQFDATLQHTSSLMDNLLYWAASQMQGYKPIIKKSQLNNIVSDILSLKQPMADAKQITLSNKTTSDIYVLADADMLAVVLRNLVSNAIKFTKREGTVSIDSETNANHVVICITDNGTGMNEKSILQFNSERIQYVDSTSGTSQEKGMGLGLLLCKTFTKLMNGNISVAQPENKTGCIFKIELPNGQNK